MKKFGLGLLLTAALCCPLPTSAQSLPALSIVGITPGYNSEKIVITPFAGAADYRVYQTNSAGVAVKPLFTKYAGDWSGVGPVETTIEWSGLTPGAAQWVVVEAVNAVGPCPPYNLTHMADDSQITAAPAEVSIMDGSNEGLTQDGWISANGQGLSADAPAAIARSAPLQVKCLPIWSHDTDATQWFGSDFSEMLTVSAPNVTDFDLGNFDETLTLPSAQTWNIIGQGINPPNVTSVQTVVFGMERHLMWIAPDGEPPGSNNPLHVAHGYIALQPATQKSTATAQIAKEFNVGAKSALYLKAVVDSYAPDGGRKCFEWFVMPHSAQITNFSAIDTAPAGAWSVENKAVLIRFGQGSVAVSVGNGFTTPAATTAVPDPSPVPSFVSVDGAAGQATYYDTRPGTGNGNGRDCSSTLECWLTANRIIVIEDGRVVCNNDLAGQTLSWLGACTANAAGDSYHSAALISEMSVYNPKALYEYSEAQGLPASDERHVRLLVFETRPIGDMP